MGGELRRLVGSAAQKDDQIADVSFVALHKKAVVGLALVGVIAVAALGYVGYNYFEGAVVQTSVVTGNVTAVDSSSTQLAGSGPVPNISRVTVKVGSDSFDVVLSCSPAPYKVGQTVQVADQLLRGGQHQYSADVACRGGVSPFHTLYPAQTNTTATSSTHT
jgi:hypothetical protein